MKDCWNVEPGERPSFAMLFEKFTTLKQTLLQPQVVTIWMDTNQTSTSEVEPISYENVLHTDYYQNGGIQ